MRLTRTLARRWLLIAGVAAYLPLYWVYFSSDAGFSLAHAAAACGGGVLDLRWSYTASTAHDYLAGCGATGRSVLAAQQLADLLYPALYTTVLASAAALLLTALAPARRGWQLLILLPPATGLAEYLENVGVWSLLASYPAVPVGVPVFSLITATKQVLSYVTFLVIGALLVAWIIDRARGHLGHPCPRRRRTRRGPGRVSGLDSAADGGEPSVTDIPIDPRARCAG